VLASSHRADVDFELVSLEGIERGWYFVRISGRGGDISPSYVLTVNPAANDAPQIEVVNPRSGDEKKPHGIETYPVLWRATDPESERTWVTVFLAPEPILDARAHLLPTSLHTRGELGFHVVNSADVPPGSYWVFCQVTDGGTTTGDWSAGTVTFVDVPDECTTLETPGPDCNANGILDACDIDAGLAADCDANGQPDTCDLATPGADDDGDGVLDRCEPARFRRGDVNDDGAINVSDPVSILRFLFVGSAAPACLESADIDNDARIVLSDAVNLLGFLFRGGPAPAPPAATSPNCGRDPDPPESSGDLGCTLFTSC
jgi:hypothetical protein